MYIIILHACMVCPCPALPQFSYMLGCELTRRIASQLVYALHLGWVTIPCLFL